MEAEERNKLFCSWNKAQFAI